MYTFFVCFGFFFVFFIPNWDTYGAVCDTDRNNYFDIKHGMSAEYCGAVDACILNIEKDGGILFSWEVSL